MLFDSVIKAIQPLTKWVQLPAPVKISATQMNKKRQRKKSMNVHDKV